MHHELTEPPDEVQLLDDAGRPIGAARRAQVHTATTPLHLAFSCYVSRGDGDLLLTRRALGKATWPGVWTNSFCGHPRPGEPVEEAVTRHARHELGIRVDDLTCALPDFRYRATDASGVVENEICPVYLASTQDEPSPHPEEVAQLRWAPPSVVRRLVEVAPFVVSPWMVLQVAQLPRLTAHEDEAEARR
jgi:isopentenyl-diphosphate Delta-isomerase